MTAEVAEQVACPEWCTESVCNGEHYAYASEYVPATAGLPRRSRSGEGIIFPAVGVTIAWNTVDHLQPCISLHISGEDVDEQPELHLHEAKLLAESLQRAIDILEGKA